MTVEEKSEGKTTVTIKGNVQSKTETKGKSFVYVDETLAVADGAPKPTKLKRTYETATTSTDGEELRAHRRREDGTHREEGREIHVHAGDGIAVAGDARRSCSTRNFNKPDKEDPRTMMLPEQAREAGRHLEDRHRQTGQGVR